MGAGGGVAARVIAHEPEREQPAEESAEERNDLLSAIKRGRNLKSAAAREQPARDSPTPGMGGLLGGEVDKILTLRSKIAADSSDSDS